MDYKVFFTTDNKSGWKTKESTLRSNAPVIYALVRDYTFNHQLNDLSFKQQIWHFINQEPNKKICLGCGGPVEFRDTITRGYRDFCSLVCANASGLLEGRAKISMQGKHGVDFFSQHESFVAKVKKTKLEKYGSENYNNMEKTYETKERLYGSKYYINKEKNKTTTRNNFIMRLTGKTDDTLVKYDLEDSHITLKCSKCNCDYEIYNNLFNYRVQYGIKPCTLCNPVNSTDSFHQKELTEFIKSLIPDEVIEETRQLIPPFEVDVYIPSHKLAIEFDGLYWHSDKFLTDDYHLNKTLACEKLGISLIHIFEDEWIGKRDIVKGILKTKLGIKDRSIFARKCVIAEVSTSIVIDFLNTNHIQGYVPSKISLGLYHDNELVSLMTLGGLRKAMGSTAVVGGFELLRFVNKLGVSVAGGFSKLLTHFIKNYNPESILTYSDRRYFSGNVYEKAGFNSSGVTRPSYSYVIRHKREYRFKYRKDVLVKAGFDQNKTEKQIMTDRGINRIYDCGNKKWCWQRP